MTREEAISILKEDLESFDIILTDDELNDFVFDGTETSVDIYYIANDYKHELATSRAIDRQFVKELDIW